MRIPSGVDTDRLRVWHALPPRRPWSLFTGEVGATAIQFSSGGKREYDSSRNSHHVLWEPASGLSSGDEHRFLSQFEVRSVSRAFDRGAVSVSWDDYESVPPLVKRTLEQQADSIPEELQIFADGIRKQSEPTTALQQFAGWVRAKIELDEAFDAAVDNTVVVLKKKKGGSAHRAHLFGLLCTASGIPARQVHGLNLAEPDGRGSLHQIRPDRENSHIWHEAYVPGAGWVEIDAAGEGNPFVVPARLIRNNDWIRNYRVEVRADGEVRTPRWTMTEGSMTSEYRVEHLIEFRSREG